jgi:hypothetical protein
MMKIKRFRKWLRPDAPQPSFVSETNQRAVGVRPGQKMKDEYTDESSLNWEVIDMIERSDPETTNRLQDECDYEVTNPHSTLRLDDDSLFGVGEDIGVDPYNTGRFDTAE